MNVKSMEFILELAEFKTLFLILAALFSLAAVCILLAFVFDRFKAMYRNRQKKKELDAVTIKNLDYSKVKDSRKSEIMRKITAPDAVDPAPNSYLLLDDGGKDVYVRTFTIASMPKITSFADTFASLFDFPGCESSVFIKPISEAAMSQKMDKQITILASEHSAAEGDPNRTRKIKDQYRELYQWAEDVESGDTKFFDVGFLFTFACATLQELNKVSDTFRTKALGKSIVVSNCFAVQAEAFMKGSPFNNLIQIGSKYIKTDGIKYFQMDKHSVSTVFNYTQNSFSHKDGIVLGRDIDTRTPIFYDLFDPSHDGYTLVIAGKTGSGKSATIKMYAARSILHDYRYVCIDSQVRKGTNEGEFAAIAELVNGSNFKISNDSDCIMNPFEIDETTKTIKDSVTSVREIRTLELNEKIGMVVNTLSTMLQGSKEFTTLENIIPVTRILTDITTALYQEFGLVDGDADSLYEMGTVVVNGEVTSGRVKKKLPTITDFYKRALIMGHNNTDESLNQPYNLIQMGLKDFVRELYYTDKTIHFLTREEVKNLRFRDISGKTRTYRNADGVDEEVHVIKGIRAYYDGQSTFSLTSDCPFTNIDISLLSEKEKKLARQIAMDFVNESFIKKNSENLRSAKKLVCIFDEAHENFEMEYARKTLDNVVRTARKRHVAIIISTQTLKEFSNWVETQAILKQATTKFVFKQDYQDSDYILNTLGITESQVDYIVNHLGGDSKNEEDQNRHRGEVCIVDNKNVAFCKVDYLKKTEALAVDTDARVIEELLSVS